jgi:hypothetical protein
MMLTSAHLTGVVLIMLALSGQSSQAASTPAAQAGPPPAYLTWYEWQAGRATLGYDAKRKAWEQDAFYVAAVLHDPDKVDDLAKLRRCTQRSIADIRTMLSRLRDPNFALPAIGRLSRDQAKLFAKAFPDASKDPVAAAVESASNADPFFTFNVERVESTLAAVLTQIKSAATCTKSNSGAPITFSLALSRRYCGSDGSFCSGNFQAFSDHGAAMAFSKILDWSSTRLNNVSGPGVNDVVFIELGKTSVDVVKAIDSMHAIATTQKWLPKRSREQELASFQKAVVKLREARDRRPARLATAAGSALSLSAGTLTRVADVVERPDAAIKRTLTASGDKMIANSGELGPLSDEFARTRIVECVRFRGLSKNDAGSVGNCSGYKVSVESIEACLADQRCTPDLGDKGWAQVQLLATRAARRAEDQAAQALLPRAAINVGIGIKAINDCGQQASRSFCAGYSILVSQGRSDSDARAIATCLESKGRQRLVCMDKIGLPSSVLKQRASYQACSTQETTDTAQCMLEKELDASLPAGVRAARDCARKFPRDQRALARCITLAQPGIGEQAKAVAECAESHPPPTRRTEFAVCVVAPHLPADQAKAVKDAASCYGGSNGDAYKTAGCLVASQVKLGGDLQLVANCFAESGGAVLGAAVCLAGDHVNAELKIAIQCAQTAVDAISYAVCVGGQLTVKEFLQCQGKRFAQENCFGTNNEFRKLARSLLNTDIGPDSVVAQSMNVSLDVVNFQVQVIGQAVELAGRLGDETGRALTDVGEAAGSAVTAAGRAAENTVQDAKTAMERALPKAPPPIQVGNIGGHRVCVPWC